MIGVDALIASLLAGVIGIGAWAMAARPSHSALVGALVAVLLWTAFSAPLWTAWRDGPPSAGVVGLFGIGSAVIAGIGVALARFADRAERAGVPASAPLAWAATALLLAGGGRLAYDGPARAPGSLAGLVFAGAVLAATAAVSVRIIRRRGSGARIGFGPLLVRSAGLAGCVAYAPLIATWLLFDRDLASIAPGPPNILALAIDRSPQDEHSLGAIESLASIGQRYELPRAGDGDPQRWLSTGAGATPVGATLRASGYATAAILRDRRFAAGTGVADVDARPGGLGQIDGPASWMSAAPVLAGPGAPLLTLLELGGETRVPSRLAADARSWLERWRTTRSGSPFFLLVDFRGPPSSSEAIDASIGALLDALDRLGAGPRTLVIALLDPEPADEPSRAVVRAPPIWSDPGSAAPRRLRPGELGEMILGYASREDAPRNPS
jgi:hypothetical protein